MTNETAKMWLKCLGPVIRSVHKKFGRLLGLSIRDIEQEAWIIADTLISSGKLDPNKKAISYVGISVHRHFGKLAINRSKEINSGSSIFESEHYTLDTTPEFFESLNGQEMKVCELLIRDHIMQDIMDELSLSQRQYYKTKRSLERKALDHVRC